MRKHRFDATDERILRLLRHNARASYRELAQAVGLSANAVAQRMRRLEAARVIQGYTTVIDPHVESPTLQAVIHLHVAVDADLAALESGLAAVPVVSEVLDLAGSIDYEIRVRCRSQAELYDAVQAVRSLPGVTDVETRPVLRHVLRR
jgi:Lrp/AsnC family leucine-responsive transcriptional regulator